MKKQSSFFLLLLMGITAVSQDKTFPVINNQPFVSGLFLNPSNSESDSLRASVALSYQGNMGVLKHINSFCGNAVVSSRDLKNDFGVLFSNEKENGFLDRIRMYGLYGRTVFLGNGWNLKTAISLGVFNYVVQASTTSAGISKMVLDGSVGASLQNKHWKLGISSQQMFASEYVLFATKQQLSRYFIAQTQYRTLLNEWHSLRFFANVPIGFPDFQFQSGTSFGFRDQFFIGFCLQQPRSMVFDIALKAPNLFNCDHLYLDFSYSIPATSQYAYMGNAFTIGAKLAW